MKSIETDLMVRSCCATNSGTPMCFQLRRFAGSTQWFELYEIMTIPWTHFQSRAELRCLEFRTWLSSYFLNNAYKKTVWFCHLFTALHPTWSILITKQHMLINVIILIYSIILMLAKVCMTRNLEYQISKNMKDLNPFFF